MADVVDNTKPNDIQIEISSEDANVVTAERKSFQFKALARKTLSYQKRQTCINCCCVCICPFLMVLIAGLLAMLFTSLLAKSTVVSSIRYCSSSPLMDSATNFPLVYANANNLLSDAATKGSVYDVNYFQLKSQSDTAFPCFQAFEKAYPVNEPYARDAVGSRSLDTSFVSNPINGWFDPAYAEKGGQPSAPPGPAGTPSITSTKPLFSTLGNSQKYPFNIAFVSSSLMAAAGNKNSAVMSSVPSGVASYGTGFFGNFPTLYFKHDPFAAVEGNSTQYVAADFVSVVNSDTTDPDAYMVSAINQAITTIETAFSTSYINGTLVNATFNSPSQRAFLVLSGVPSKYPLFGAIYLQKLDSATNKLSATLQAGRSGRLATAVQNMASTLSFQYNLATDANSVVPAIGFRLMYQISRLSNALLASSSDALSNLVQISHAVRAFPQSVQWGAASLPYDIGVEVGKPTYPFGLTFLLPIFVLTLVKEKEDRILIMMKMHGLTAFTYYLAHYIHFLILQVVCSIVFIIAGAIFKLKFFTETDPGVYLILLFLWANAMIALSFLLSLLFSKSRFALIATFFVVVVSNILTLFEDTIFNYESPPIWWYLWPIWAFCQGLTEIATASSGLIKYPYTMSALVPGDLVRQAMLFLLFETIVMFLLMGYLNSVIPTEYGIAKKWHFIFTDPYKYLTKGRGKVADREVAELESHETDGELEGLEDDDVQAERKRVLAMKLDQKTFSKFPLVIKSIRKVYSGGKIANRNMCLAVEKNLVFGLLGPNGAGKSTMIQMLTGLYPPTSGNAYVSGFDIVGNMPMVYLNIGVCPQHDILWDDLTIEEHLLFYTRLRGIPAEQEAAVVDKAIAEVELQTFKTTLSKALSGGQKRRLSIAIALLANTSVVFLDEPTTGLDPEVRRTIWSIIQNAKQGRTIILTSHSMEEVDFLASSMAIMAKGVMRCLGTPLHLKRKYGPGFNLTLSFYKDGDRETIMKTKSAAFEKGTMMSREDATAYIQDSILPAGNWKKLEQGGVVGNAIYQFNDNEPNIISHILESMDSMKEQLGVEDWGISQTSLEEVFLNIIKDDDADASQ